MVYIPYVKGTVTLTWINFKIDRDHLYSETNVCTKFDELRSILCLVIIRTISGLYINMLTVTVTLTFDRLTSKSIGIIYTPRQMSATFEEPTSILCLVIIILSIYQHVDGHCGLSLRRFNLKIYKNHLNFTTNVCDNFGEPRSKEIINTPRHMSAQNLTNLSQFSVVIIRTNQV